MEERYEKLKKERISNLKVSITYEETEKSMINIYGLGGFFGLGLFSSMPFIESGMRNSSIETYIVPSIAFILSGLSYHIANNVIPKEIEEKEKEISILEKELIASYSS